MFVASWMRATASVLLLPVPSPNRAQRSRQGAGRAFLKVPLGDGMSSRGVLLQPRSAGFLG
jgi:hypothetical protein